VVLHIEIHRTARYGDHFSLNGQWGLDLARKWLENFTNVVIRFRSLNGISLVVDLLRPTQERQSDIGVARVAPRSDAVFHVDYGALRANWP
jgi:hypothetical protein